MIHAPGRETPSVGAELGSQGRKVETPAGESPYPGPSWRVTAWTFPQAEGKRGGCELERQAEGRTGSLGKGKGGLDEPWVWGLGARDGASGGSTGEG